MSAKFKLKAMSSGSEDEEEEEIGSYAERKAEEDR